MKRLTIGLALASATPVAARDLPVPLEKGWKHAQTGLILMYRLGDLTRTSLTDATTSEHDVAVQFDSFDKDVFATIYLFRPAISDVAIWFDRSRSALETRDLFRAAAPATIDPVGFAVGGAPTASSLRQVYAVAGGRYKSTALAVIPMGDWIVTIRMSARTMTAAQLDVKLLDMAAAVQWPKPTASASQAGASPIKPCGTQLKFKKAKQVKPNTGDMLMSLLAGAVAAQKAGAAIERSPRNWCREGDGQAEYGVYRSDGSSEGYVLALGDAGRAVSVSPSVMGQVDKTGGYTVSLEDVDGSVSTYSSFASLPAPEQVWDVVQNGRRTGTTRGKQITIDPKAL